MKRIINWGIIGPGRIANKFASDLNLSKNSKLYAVASRDINKAEEFGKRHNSVKWFDSYEQLVKCSEIDIIYIATPHVFHYEQTMLCLKNNKNVLCEKPLGMNQFQITEMINEAKSRNLFLMEGVWTRFIPATEKFLELISNDKIGEIISVKADFGFKSTADKTDRLYDKKLGAGSLLDIGIYPVYLSLLTLGIPSNIKTMARFTDNGIDSYCNILLDYENKAKAILESTIEANTPVEAYIYGTKGKIKLHSRFHHTQKISLFQNGELREIIEIPYVGNGYYHEIEEVNKCLLNKKTESDKMPLKTSLELTKILDAIRKDIGLEY